MLFVLLLSFGSTALLCGISHVCKQLINGRQSLCKATFLHFYTCFSFLSENAKAIISIVHESI